MSEEQLFRDWAKDWRDSTGEPAGYNPDEHFIQQAIDILTSRRSFAEEYSDKWYRIGNYENACRAERRVSRINHVLFHMMRFYHNSGQ